MKLTTVGNLAAIGALLLFTIVFLAEWQTKMGAPRERSLIVRIPPPHGADEQQISHFWQFNELLFSYEDFVDAPFTTKSGMLQPIEVSIQKDSTIKINSKVAGSVEDTKPLKLKLLTIFRLRDNYDVNVLATHRRARGVTLSAPLSAKYGEVCAVLDAIKESGADPIVLLIDGLPDFGKVSAYGR